MKKIFIYSSAIVFALSTLSCTKEVGSDIAAPGKFFAVSEEAKSALGADGHSVAWQLGDEIVITNGSQNVDFTCSSAGTNAEFETTGSLSQADMYYAVYPKTGSIAISSQAPVFTVAIPAAQNAIDGTYTPSAAVSGAYAESDRVLKFKNFASLVKFSVSDENLITKIVLAGSSAVAAESFTATFATAKMTDDPVYSYSGEATNIEVTPKSGTFFKEGTYYVAVLPGKTHSSISVSFYSGTKLVAKRVRSKELTTVRNTIYEFGEFEMDVVEQALANSEYINSVNSFKKRTVYPGLIQWDANITLTVAGSSTQKTTNLHVLQYTPGENANVKMRYVVAGDNQYYSSHSATAWLTERTNATKNYINDGLSNDVVLAMLPGELHTGTEPRGPVRCNGVDVKTTYASNCQGYVALDADGRMAIDKKENKDSDAKYSSYKYISGGTDIFVYQGAKQTSGYYSAGNAIRDGIGYTESGVIYNVMIEAEVHQNNFSDFMYALGCYNAIGLQTGRNIITRNADKSYTIYGADSGNSINNWAIVATDITKTRTQTVVAGLKGTSGNTDAAGTGAPNTTARFTTPEGLIPYNDGSGFYVIHRVNTPARIRKMNYMNTVSTLVNNASLTFPWGGCNDGSDGLYICNKAANTISHISKTGTISAVKVSGATLNNPMTCILDNSGKLVVANRNVNQILVGTIDGTNNTYTVEKTIECPGYPCSLAMDVNGTIFIGSTNIGNNTAYNRIRMLTHSADWSTYELSIIAGTGVQNSNSASPNNGTAGQPLTAQVSMVEGLNFGRDGILYFGDVNGTTSTGALRCLVPNGDYTISDPADFYGKGTINTLATGLYSNTPLFLNINGKLYMSHSSHSIITQYGTTTFSK